MTAARSKLPQVNPWLVLVLVCLAQFMVILDATIVNVALPTIQNDLHISETNLQWIVNAYTLTFGGFLLLGGRAGDLIGRKKVFLAGVVLFTFASLMCALAQGDTWLILMRGLQGLGAALVSPAALSIVTATFREGAERTKALGVWSAIAVGGGAVGLLLGGILVDLLSWPWIFVINVPVGIVTFILSLRLVPESKDEHAHRSFDVAGAICVTSGLIALVFGIVRSAELGWGSGQVLGILALATVLLVGFVVIESRSSEPLVRLSIFAVRTVRAANVSMFVVSCGMFSMFFFNTLYVQRVLGYSALQAGLAFLPFTAGIILGAGASQQLIPRLGAREVPVMGLSIAVVGMLLFLRLDPSSTYVKDMLPGIMLASIGLGLTFVPVTLIATSGMPVDDAGLASGLFNTSQQVGGALGLALLSTFAANKTADALARVGHKPTQADTAQALVDGFHIAWLGCALLLAAGAVLLLAMLRRSDVVTVAHGEAETVAL
jgi:EmrB/QacA subfamily drug resistance transporter